MNGRLSAICGSWLTRSFRQTSLIVECAVISATREGTGKVTRSIVIPYTSPEGYQVLPYECHEGNLAILQGLGGERAEDKALDENAKRGILRPRRPIQGGQTVGGQPIPEGGPR